jgi:hypothetical protein
MNDIDTEIVTLRTLRTDMLSSIKSALDEGTEDVTEASWSCSPSYDFDELINQIGDDGSLLDELPKGDE